RARRAGGEQAGLRVQRDGVPRPRPAGAPLRLAFRSLLEAGRVRKETLGPTAYLAAKAKGDNSMPSKRDEPGGAQASVPQGPRDRAKAALLEPQPPVMYSGVPRCTAPTHRATDIRRRATGRRP